MRFLPLLLVVLSACTPTRHLVRGDARVERLEAQVEELQHLVRVQWGGEGASAPVAALNWAPVQALRKTLLAGAAATSGGGATLTGAGNGTAAAPAFSFTSDPDTGIYRVGANEVGISTGGTLGWSQDSSQMLKCNKAAGGHCAVIKGTTWVTDDGVRNYGYNAADMISFQNLGLLATGPMITTGTVTTYSGGGVEIGRHTGFGGLWTGSSVVAGPTLNNYFLLDAGDRLVNAVSGQSLLFRVDNIPKTGLDLGGTWFYTAQAATVASDGAGTAAASTLTPTTSNVVYTCNDTDGCDITLSETGARDGALLRVTNASANAVNFADTAGVSETSGALSLGQWDSVEFRYITDRWVQVTAVQNN